MKNNEFKGLWISKEILGAKDLNSSEKLVLAIISVLDGDKGCYATYDYIADNAGMTKRNVINCINKLVDKGYIDREYINKTNTVLKISEKISSINNGEENATSEKISRQISEKNVRIGEKISPNNIYNINKYNTNNIECGELLEDSNGNTPLQNKQNILDVVIEGKVINKKNNVIKFPCTSYNKKEEDRISLNNLPYSNNVPKTNGEWQDLEYRLLGWA
ncbi:helix-turn-helix domain-containing protein [Clostridium butyricum]|nr:helix-turn-helix domain-containing protein [Clostridium butyricum]MDU3594736.1 helix-turn-helix domain-containing protein [Clostridium butyricum]